MTRRLLALAAAIGLAAGASVFPAGSASAAVPSTGWLATLKPVAANRVSGNGIGWITLTGDSAEFTVQIAGLIAAPHAMNIRVNAAGKCPDAATGTMHQGKMSVSESDAAPGYGKVGASLTLSGDTSTSSTLAVKRYPDQGDFVYKRTFDLDPTVVANLHKGTAVMVVHGIDYNSTGGYDDALGASDVDSALPAEATDPALCGAFVAAQMPEVPRGSANTGGGSTAASENPALLVAGGAALLAALIAGGVAFRRRAR
jgi:hypothetical protein